MTRKQETNYVETVENFVTQFPEYHSVTMIASALHVSTLNTANDSHDTCAALVELIRYNQGLW